jgi:hypothetical protein
MAEGAATRPEPSAGDAGAGAGHRHDHDHHHDHDHGRHEGDHAHDHAHELRATPLRRLGIAFVLTASFMFVEAIVGWMSNCFVVAIDNDRAPPHAAHAETAPHARECRHCQIMDAIHEGMPDGWPILGAVAVPVEMIEAWLLLMVDPVRYARESDLPACARRDQAVARERHGASPPPQLKDLVDEEQRGLRSATKADFALACVLRLDPAALAERAPSFAHFRRQVSAWGAPGGSPPGLATVSG